MTTFNVTCEAVEATLPDYLDETLEGWVRASIEEHLGECVRCRALAHELRNITREAAALPALFPEHEIWPRIAGRIGAPASVSGRVAENPPQAPTPEPTGLASNASLPLTELPVLTNEPPVVAPEPPVVTREPVVVTREPEVMTREPVVVTREPLVVTRESLEMTSELPEPVELPVRTREPPEPPEPAVVTSDLPKPLVITREPPATAATEPLPTTAPLHGLPSREKRWERGRMGLAAAALVLVTAATSSLLTVQWVGRARTPNIAGETGAPGPSSSGRRAEPGVRGPPAGHEQVASNPSAATPSTAQLGSALTASATSPPPPVTRSPEEVVYDKEIKTLQRIVRRQKPELDPSTVVVIEKNLRTLDSAIAQIRAALQKDPGSPLLSGQASRALEMKVELLRRAAMMRSNTI